MNTQAYKGRNHKEFFSWKFKQLSQNKVALRERDLSKELNMGVTGDITGTEKGEKQVLIKHIFRSRRKSLGKSAWEKIIASNQQE